MKNELKKAKIKVLLVDDHPFVLEGVRSCLVRYEQFEVVGEAATGQQAINMAKEFSEMMKLCRL